MTHRKKNEAALEAIYAEIPAIPDCEGRCVTSCGPIAMFVGEWARVKRSAGRSPRLRAGSLTCPLLSPAGRCTVYSVRPYICRLWGTTRALACPYGCTPECWLTEEQARDIFERIREIAGPRTAGPLGDVTDLWTAIDLEGRRHREGLIAAARAHQATIDEIRQRQQRELP